MASKPAATAASPDPPEMLGFWSFLARELTWGRALPLSHAAARTAGSTAAFLRIPLHVEPFTLFGHLVCADLFLFQFTLLPFRCAVALLALAAAAVHAALPCLAGRGKPPSWLQLDKASLFALLKMGIILGGTAVLGSVQVSRVYHYIRGEAIIKLYVIFNILEILDKLFASMGQDVLDALYRFVRDTDVLALGAPSGRGCSHTCVRNLAVLVMHGAVAVAYVTLHSIVIFVQIVCLNVAINSRNNALLTLLVSNNFVELKAGVFKRFEAENLFQLACSDAVERFQLSLFLLLICMQEATSWDALLRLLSGVLSILCVEVLVDNVKHSFICKFNRLSADLYGSFSAILAHDMVSVRGRMRRTLDPTHARSRRIGLSSLPLAAVVLRLTLNNVHPSWWPRMDTLAGVVVAALCLCVLASAKLLSSAVCLSVAARAITMQRDTLVHAVHTITLASPRVQPRSNAADVVRMSLATDGPQRDSAAGERR